MKQKLLQRVLCCLMAVNALIPAAFSQVADEPQINFAWTPPDDRQIVELGEQIAAITLSMPGNVAVLYGPDGVLLVDNQMPPFDAQMVEDVQTITGDDASAVRFVVNTHGHPDHLGSNALWKARGAVNIAHDNVRRRLAQPGSLGPGAPADIDAMQPTFNYNREMRFHMNGQTVYVVHPAPAHTDGDSIVFFEQANVLHTGDIYLNRAFPVIDPSGSLDGIIAALEGIAVRIDDETQIIPGHGPISNKSELESYTAGLRRMRSIIGDMIEQGMTLEQVRAADPLAQFADEFDLLTGMFNTDFVAANIYQTLSAAE